MAKMPKTGSDELLARQKTYDDLVAFFGGTPIQPQSTDAWELHKRVVRILDGREPDPRRSHPLQET